MFRINVEALPLSEAFPYLRWMIANNSSDWPEVDKNLKKAWRWWRMITRMLSKAEATVRVS